MSLSNKSQKIKHENNNLEIFNYKGNHSKPIPHERIIFADDGIDSTMFYATVSFWVPNKKTIESEWYVGYSSSMELTKACKRLLQKYFSMPSDHEHYIFWKTDPDALVGQITVDLLDGNGASVVTETIANSYFHSMKELPDEEKFSYFIYRTIMNPVPVVKPPWLTHVNFNIYLSKQGINKFNQLLKNHQDKHHSSLS
jgi:hypothetical protein